LPEEATRTYFNWIFGDAEPAGNHGRSVWLLAHSYDGVTWGRFDSDRQVWSLSSDPFPDLCPEITESNLIEMRLFGPYDETLIWRTDSEFAGRRLIDEPEADLESPTRSDEEIRILLGDRMLSEPKNGFTLVGTASGAEQAVPMVCAQSDFENRRWPLRLKVRHYFIKDDETGAVRVAATRLVDVFKEVR
jgi:CRISPR-associated protein (TIGR03984 family)